MNKLRSRPAALIAAVAALSMTASPVLARGYDDWGRHRHHHHRDRVDGGDILAGLLIVGGIAAIASAASKASKDKEADQRYRYPGGPRDGDGEGDRGYGEAPDEPSGYPGVREPGSFDEAVDRCAEEIERGERRIGAVDNVGRAGDRYSVEGQLEDGRGFACSVDETGRVRSVAVDGRAMI